MSLIRNGLFVAICLIGLIWAFHADAACPSPLTGKDASGVSQNFATQNDASNNCVGESAAYQAVQFTGTLQSSAVANGNGTALSTTGLAGATMTVNCASCSGGTTVNFEAQEDGSDFVPLQGTKLDGSAQGTTVTTAGVTIWQFNLSGVQQIRARISGYSAGTVTVTAHAIAVPAHYPTMGVLQTTSPWVVNQTQVGGSALALGQTTMSASIPVAIASNQSGITANAGTNLNTSALALDTSVQNIYGCAGQTVANTNVAPFSNAASSTALKLVSKVAAKNVYICGINISNNAAVNVALVEGTLTTTNCDTATAGMAGGATAATGWQFIANGGETYGDGRGVMFKTATVNHDVCLFFSAATQVSGVITWAQF